jgi:aspartate aminotransferase-like enzyme
MEIKVMGISLFNDEKDATAVQTIRETMSVSLSDDGTPIVSFATNRGKGSGAQSMPVADFAAYVEALEEVAANGIEERADEHLSPADTVRQTIQNSDGVISFRVRNGKGAKPAKVDASEFGEVCSLLSDTLEAVEAAAEKLAE